MACELGFDDEGQKAPARSRVPIPWAARLLLVVGAAASIATSDPSWSLEDSATLDLVSTPSVPRATADVVVVLEGHRALLGSTLHVQVELVGLPPAHAVATACTPSPAFSAYVRSYSDVDAAVPRNVSFDVDVRSACSALPCRLPFRVEAESDGTELAWQFDLTALAVGGGEREAPPARVTVQTSVLP